MRTHLRLGQAGTVRTINGREDRILALGLFPSLLKHDRGHGHGGGWLMAGYTRPSVGAERGKERMILRLDRPIEIQNT